MENKQRGLVVDDEAEIREMLIEYLNSHGFETIAADSGKSMRELLEKQVPDVVLLDVNLPGEDGITVARFVRERFDLPIIMVTAADEVVDRVVGLEVGADDYLTKPFDPRELRAASRPCCAATSAWTRPQPRPRKNHHASAFSLGAARSTSIRASCSTPTTVKSCSPAWNSICSTYSPSGLTGY